MERDYMKEPAKSKVRIVVLPSARRFSTFTPTQWTNVLILALALVVIGVILSYRFR